MSASKGDDIDRTKPVTCWLKSALLCGTAMALCMGTAVKAGPQGTTVTAGAVSIQQTGQTTVFNQSTPTAILNHTSFDINAGETVRFQQPSAQALAVNRITGTDLPTRIAGELTANGNVWVLNPSGVAISRGASVNVNGLLASTAQISNDDILAGKVTLSGAGLGTAVTNAGTITAGDGHVVLVAPVVTNDGAISTKGSDVVLGAGSGLTVDFDGDGLTRIAVDDAVGSRIVNSGTITAEGGAVLISAADARAVRDQVVSIGGAIEATRAEDRGGIIVISGGDAGVVEIDGSLRARGDRAALTVTGDAVALRETARLSAGGPSTGGEILIGGDRAGAPITHAPDSAPLPRARRVLIAEGARIDVSAPSGNGGEIVVWGTEAAAVSGALLAHGAGDGGFIEVSSAGALFLDATLDVGAGTGASGAVLIDPLNIVIATGGTAAPSVDILFTDTPGATTTIDPAYLTAAAGTLTLQATNDVTVADDVIGATATVVIDAGRDIVIDAALSTSADLTLRADFDFSGGGGDAPDGDGTVSFGAAGALTGSTITIETGEALAIGDVTASIVDLTAGGAITQTVGSTLAVSGDFTADAGSADITLSNTTNDFADEGSGSTASLSGGAISIFDTSSIALGTVTGTGVTVSANDVSIATSVDVGTGTLRIQNTDSVFFDVGFSSAFFDLETSDLSNISAGTVILDTNNISAFVFGISTLASDVAFDAGIADVLLFGNLTGVTGLDVVANDFLIAGATTIDVGTGAITGDLSGTFQLAETTAGSIDLTLGDDLQLLGDTTLTGTLDITSTSADGLVLFDTAVAGGPSTLDTGAFTLVSTDFTAATTVGSLTMNTQDLSGNTTVALTAGGSGDISIDGLTANALSLSAAGGDVGFDGADTNAASVDITASASVSQTAALITAGDLSVVSSGAIVLDDAGNAIAGTVAASAAAMTLAEAGTVTLGDLDIAGDLAVTAGGDILDDGTFNIAGDASFTADPTEDIVLDAGTHAFGGRVHAVGEQVLIRQLGPLLAGSITASGGTNSADAASATLLLTEAGEEIALSAGDIDLRNATFDGSSALTAPRILIASDGAATVDPTVAAAVSASSHLSFQSTGALTLDGATLGAPTVSFVTSAVGDGIVGTTGGGDLSLAGSIDGNARLISGGDIVQTSALSVTGTTYALAADDTPGAAPQVIALDTATNVFGDTVDALASGSIALASDEALELGVVSAGFAESDVAGTGRTLGVVAGGAITQQGPTMQAAALAPTTGGRAVFVRGSTAASGTLGSDLAGARVEAADGATLDATQGGAFDVTLANPNNDIDRLGDGASADRLDALAANLVLVDQSALRLGAVAASGDLSVTTSGTLADTTGQGVIVAGETTLSTAGADIALNGSALHDFSDVNGLTATGGDIAIDEIGGLAIADITAAANGDPAIADGSGRVRITSTGGIEIASTSAAGDLALIAATGITMTGAVATDANAVLTAGTGIAQSAGALSVAGTTVAMAGGDITLDGAGNDFVGAVSLDGDSATIVDATSLAFDAVRLTGTFDATATGGSLTDLGSLGTAGSGIVVDGQTTLAATGVVTLDDAANDFDADAPADTPSDAVNVSGTDVALVDATGIALGAIAVDTLSVEMLAGPILNAAAGTVSVAGDVDLTAGMDGRIQLRAADLGGLTTLSGGDMMLSVDTGAVRVGTVTAGGDVVIRAASGDLRLTEQLSMPGNLVLRSETGNLDLSAITVASTAGPGAITGATITAGGRIALLTPEGTLVLPVILADAAFQLDAGSVETTVTATRDGAALAFDDADLADVGFAAADRTEVLAANRFIEIHVGSDLEIVAPSTGSDIPSDGYVDLDFPSAGSAVFRIDGGQDGATAFAIGDQTFIDAAVGPFDSLASPGALADDSVLLDVAGGLDVIAQNGSIRFNTQNTTSQGGSAEDGTGTVVTRVLSLTQAGADAALGLDAGALVEFSTFGSLNGQSGTNAALQVAEIGFQADNRHTVNGCIIGELSSCTALGSIVLSLQFETGQFLTITFVDPDEEEDITFSNRGDEEEWE